MKRNEKVSGAVIKRLPRYRRYLRDMVQKGITRISSKEFSELLGYTASQIRQDLNNFGGFGQQGYGYNVKELYDQISKILGITRDYHMVIIGSKHMGQAIANFSYLKETGFYIDALFDINPNLIGQEVNGIIIENYKKLDKFLEDNQIDIGIICTNKESAQEVATKLEVGGVKGIWNFAPVDLSVAENINVENVHVSDSLHTLTYYINRDDEIKP